jgi:hypothetical protein
VFDASTLLISITSHKTLFDEAIQASSIPPTLLVSPTANTSPHSALSGKALTSGMKNKVKFAEGDPMINPF